MAVTKTTIIEPPTPYPAQGTPPCDYEVASLGTLRRLAESCKVHPLMGPSLASKVAGIESLSKPHS